MTIKRLMQIADGEVVAGCNEAQHLAKVMLSALNITQFASQNIERILINDRQRKARRS